MPESIFESLEKDKVETGATGEVVSEKPIITDATVVKQVVEKTEPTVEKKEVEVKKEEVKTEPTNDWWKDLDFESPEAAKEFINTKKSEKVVEVKPKFAKPSVESYNNWIENGGVEDFGLFQAVNKFSISENPTPEEMVEALVLQKVLDDPEYKGEENILRSKFKKQFGLDVSEEDKALMEDDEKGELKLKLIDLKKDFKTASEKFKGLQEKTTPKKDEAFETRLKENPIKLKEHLDKEVTTLNLDIQKRVKTKDGQINFEDSLYNIKFDESMQKTYRENYELYAKENNFPDLGDGSHNGMKAVAMVMAIGSNLQNVMNDIYEAGLAAGKSDSVKAEIDDTNFTSIGTHEKKNVTADSGDKSGEMFNK